MGGVDKCSRCHFIFREIKSSEPAESDENAFVPTEVDPGQNGNIKELQAILEQNAILLQDVKSMIQDRLEYDTVKEKAFDKLYEEMKRQRELSDVIDRNIRPLLSDLLMLYDSMQRFDTWLANSKNSSDAIRTQLEKIVDELIEALYRQEITLMEPAEMLNAKHHRAIKTEKAETPEEDFKIVNIVRKGFLWRDKVLRPQEVTVKRFVSNG